MKILHTADWHLGVKIPQLGIDRIKEQEKIIEKIKSFIYENQIDVVVISGDIFDIPLPSIEAEKILFRFLSDVAGDMRKHVLIINGNHDSIDKIETLNTLSRVFVGRIKSFVITGRFQDSDLLLDVDGVNFLGIPFTPRYRYSGEYQGIFESILNYFLSKVKDNVILFSHDLVEGAKYSGSEAQYDDKVLKIESIRKVNGFSKIIYWALGHIHEYQEISKNEIYYPGSIIQINFGEKNRKGVIVLELESMDVVDVRFIEILQEITLQQIRAKDKRDIEEIIENKDQYSSKFLKIIVNDKIPYSLIREIRDKMDNVILLSESSVRKQLSIVESIQKSIDDPIETFKNYCKELQREVNDDEINILKQIYDHVKIKFNV
ncbi:MAG: exonuclease SbcCD subunit D [Brevinematia bacterium]